MDKTIRLKKLYHFTTSEAAAEIMEYGFPAGEAGKIWFALHPADVFDEGSGATVLLEIRILPDDIIPFEVKEEHAEGNSESPGSLRAAAGNGE